MKTARCAWLLAALFLGSLRLLAAGDNFEKIATGSLLDPIQPMVEAQVFLGTHVNRFPSFSSLAAWQDFAARTRKRIFDEVVFGGAAKKWRDAPVRIVWLQTIPGGPGYHIRKLRYEAVPGLWIPALLYEPDKLAGKAPFVLNVSGHEPSGKAAAHKQINCINQAKRGMFALNTDWLWMGQLRTDGFAHPRMNQIDLAGASGVSVFYLALKKAIDAGVSLPQVDPKRIAVSGLSGGGWQTIFISALDTRVAVADSVAGYSAFMTKGQLPEPNLGDSEQVATDLGKVADYTHLTALMAPRRLMIAENAKDDCCFRADYTLAPLYVAAKPVFDLYGLPGHFQHHISYDPGHNYALSNREAFYRLLGEAFFPNDKSYPRAEIASEKEVKTAEELAVELPKNNADLHTLALGLLPDVPRPLHLQRAAMVASLRETVRARNYDVDPHVVAEGSENGVHYTTLRLKLGGFLTIPVVVFAPPGARATSILLADGGRASIVRQARELVESGHRVVLTDLLNIGESEIVKKGQQRGAKQSYLFELADSGIGERPIGMAASELIALARWLDGPSEVVSYGPLTSLVALIGAGIEEKAISGLALHDSLTSLKEIVEKDWTVDKHPDFFCFGLLEHFDIPQLTALVKPRHVVFADQN